MSRPDIRVGIGGWNYAPWRDNFYPKGLAQAKELEYASSRFGAIEINATFYGRQKPASWEKWEKTVPDGFQFAIKASRFCVSRSKLAEGQESIANFVGQGFSALGPKLGPILWQFQARRQFDREDIAAFLELLPAEVDGVKLRHALEPRHESFNDEAFFALCRDHDVAVVHDDSEDYPAIQADTASFAYSRLQRMSSDIPTGYDAAALDGFAKAAKAQAKDGRSVYVFMINGAKERAPAAALALQERLR
jgi:uncharacterized protein YecE (DUF72 family)